MPDVLLGQAYFLRFDPKLWRAMQPFAPLGTLYAAAYLRRQGHSVALFDAMLADSEREWALALDRTRPMLAALYEDNFNYLSKMCLLRMRQAALGMIEAARTRGCAVVVSGSDATDHPDVYLDAGATAVIVGEGEVTLDEIVTAMKNRGSLANVAGVAYLRNGRSDADDAATFASSAGRSAASSVGPHRRGSLPRGLARPAWLSRHERRHHARLPVPLQLVRKTDLRTTLRGPIRRRCRRRDRVAATRLRARPAVDRRRCVRLAAWLGGDFRRAHRGTQRQDAVSLSDARRSDRRRHRAGAGGGGLPHGVDGSRVRIAAHARRHGEGRSRRADPPGRETAAGRGNPGRNVPAVRLSGRGVGGRRADALAGTRHVTRRHRRVGLVSVARHEVLRARSAQSLAPSRTGSIPTIWR